ncbi:hypothetical protein PanWU01x14_167370 [Parasponia andersonii]|uniref:Uncharacterized protein n=1 Tax=Parasponia andersonii TaxID=3476 RepID=A0A2P5CBH0_PARAD|nr:hypothetical protein PanWU01x14_167370 [Parasponia andersonii]
MEFTGISKLSEVNAYKPQKIAIAYYSKRPTRLREFLSSSCIKKD